MTRTFAASLGAAWLLGTAPAFALEIAPQQASPAAVGEAHAFHIDGVSDAKGAVTYRWNFGDGTIVGPGAAGEVEHTYQSAGHYTVIVLATDAEENRTSTSWIQTAHAPLSQPPPSQVGNRSISSSATRRACPRR